MYALLSLVGGGGSRGGGGGGGVGEGDGVLEGEGEGRIGEWRREERWGGGGA